MEQSIAILVVLCSLTLLFIIGSGQTSFNVMDFGAKGDGETDDSPAFTKAWEALCGSSEEAPLLQLPQGDFLLKPIKFNGPCKSKIVHIQVLGKIVAPMTREAWGACTDCFLCFYNVEGLILYGSGSIDGRGQEWWHKGTLNDETCKRPAGLRFRKCDNLKLQGLTHLNSPKQHIFISHSNGVSISNLNITAPQDSPNTDGINLISSTQVNIFDSNIGTGDDCVAINEGCSFVNITNVNCGPGHGISIGSLGEGPAAENVEEVNVKHCTFTGTQNGARIKTIPGGQGYARKIIYENITLNGAKHPILIDQYYCQKSDNSKGCSHDQPSMVKVSEVTYTGFRGTSASSVAIALNCSTIECTGITMSNNEISSSYVEGGPSKAKTTRAYCINAQGTQTLTTPLVPCLQSYVDH